MRTPDQVQTINDALQRCPVYWGREGLPLYMIPASVTHKEQFATRQSDSTGQYMIDAEGKIIVEWMRAIDAAKGLHGSRTAYGEMFVTYWDYSGMIGKLAEAHATDRTDWLLTLAEAILEVFPEVER